MNIYHILNELNINYEEIEHKSVYTVEEANSLKDRIKGTGCKNLFFTDKKNNYFLYLLRDDKKADLKELSNFLNVKRLTFGNDDDLNNLLGLTKGSVTPLGIINDKDNKVRVVIDKVLVGEVILVHPNVNTKTIAITYEDLIKFIKYIGNEYELY